MFEVAVFVCICTFSKFVFLFEIAATLSLSPLPLPTGPHNLSEHSSSSYLQVPFHLAQMMLYSEAQTLINSYFRCVFPGCQRSFPTELGLKKHHNLIHPDWISDEGTGNSSTDHMLVLTVALDPLPHLYTLYSDNIESNSELEDNLNVAILDNKIEQGESDFSKSVSFPLTTRVYVSKMKPT